MRLPPFHLEQLFARHEFSADFNLTGSDTEGISLSHLLGLADAETRDLWDALTLGYTESRGHPLLREQIAAEYATVAVEGVHVFAGASEAMFILANVLLGPGDHAIALGPSYQLLADVPRATGAEITDVYLRREDQWALDLERIRAALRPNTRIIITNFPHNPTGALPDAATFSELVELAERSGAYLVSDEIYRGLEADPDGTLPAGVDLAPHVITLSGVSKVYGLAGVRVGWLVTRDRDLMETVSNFRYWTTLCTSAASELLALVALRAAPQLLARAREITSHNRTRFESFMAEHRDALDWVPPVGGTVAFPWLRSGSADAFCEQLLNAHSVLLAPASVFKTGGEHFRIGLGRRALEDGLPHVARVLAGYPKAA